MSYLNAGCDNNNYSNSNWLCPKLHCERRERKKFIHFCFQILKECAWSKQWTLQIKPFFQFMCNKLDQISWSIVLLQVRTFTFDSFIILLFQFESNKYCLSKQKYVVTNVPTHHSKEKNNQSSKWGNCFVNAWFFSLCFEMSQSLEYFVLAWLLSYLLWKVWFNIISKMTYLDNYVQQVQMDTTQKSLHFNLRLVFTSCFIMCFLSNYLGYQTLSSTKLFFKSKGK